MKDAVDQLTEGTVTTGNFTIQAQLPMGKTITLSGYIYAHNTLDAINKQVDLYHDVIDRQRVRAEIPELEAKLDQKHGMLMNFKDSIDGLIRKKEAGQKLTSQEKQAVENMNISITRAQEDIAKGEKAVLEAKKAVGRE